jgi:hypothetical protein
MTLKINSKLNLTRTRFEGIDSRRPEKYGSRHNVWLRICLMANTEKVEKEGQSNANDDGKCIPLLSR